MTAQECAVCLENMERTTCIKTHCCSQMLHLECYIPCEKCPFCRAEQPKILPVIIMKHDYAKLLRFIFGVSLTLGFASIIVMSAQCDP